MDDWKRLVRAPVVYAYLIGLLADDGHVTKTIMVQVPDGEVLGQWVHADTIRLIIEDRPRLELLGLAVVHRQRG